MIRKVAHFISQQRLFQPDELVLVALSGGADSVALLCLLSELHYNIQALHCNFHLRGEESDRDEHFVKALCDKMGIPLHIQHFQTKEYASKHGQSIEMAARELRYGWFENMRQRLNARCIAVAHHKDDQAETILLNLIRGAGLKGLAGMKPKRDRIVRPLLCVGRNEILQYLQTRRQDYVTDSTNLERDALRNRIRLDVLPLLRQMNPSITETLSNTCRNIQGSLPIYENGLQQLFLSGGVTTGNFPIPQPEERDNTPTLLHEWLAGKGFTAAQEQEVLQSLGSEPGKCWESNEWRLLKDRTELLLKSKTGNTSIPTLQQETVEKMTDQGPDIAYFDADKLSGDISIRKVQKGDWFVPFGMKGRKLVSDFLTDRKQNLFQKEDQYVAFCGGEIIWLIGQRSDNRFRVTAQTKRIIKLTIKKEEL